MIPELLERHKAKSKLILLGFQDAGHLTIFFLPANRIFLPLNRVSWFYYKCAQCAPFLISEGSFEFHLVSFFLVVVDSWLYNTLLKENIDLFILLVLEMSHFMYIHAFHSDIEIAHI